MICASITHTHILLGLCYVKVHEDTCHGVYLPYIMMATYRRGRLFFKRGEMMQANLTSTLPQHMPSRHGPQRFTSTSTETWEEAQSLKSDVMEAWKRRRKKLDRSLRSSRPESPLLKTGVSAPDQRSLRSRRKSSRTPPAQAPGLRSENARRLHGDSDIDLRDRSLRPADTGVSGPPHRSLRPATPESPA